MISVHYQGAPGKVLRKHTPDLMKPRSRQEPRPARPLTQDCLSNLLTHVPARRAALPRRARLLQSMFHLQSFGHVFQVLIKSFTIKTIYHPTVTTPPSRTHLYTSSSALNQWWSGGFELNMVAKCCPVLRVRKPLLRGVVCRRIRLCQKRTVGCCGVG